MIWTMTCPLPQNSDDANAWPDFWREAARILRVERDDKIGCENMDGQSNEQPTRHPEREQESGPISERFRLIAKRWVEADEAASLLEETKSTVLSEMITKIIGYNIGMAYNKAELSAKSSPEYKEFVTEMVHLRSKANLLKVKMEYIRMQFSEQQSHEATARAERRL